MTMTDDLWMDVLDGLPEAPNEEEEEVFDLELDNFGQHLETQVLVGG